MRYTEQQIIKMSMPITETEETKCKNAIRMVSDAMKKLGYQDDGEIIREFVAGTFSYTLNLRKAFSDRSIKLLVQGSYANKTNIPSESDVDVAVILESTFTAKYRQGVKREDYGFTEGTFLVSELKDEVEKALNIHFGYQGVERHDKSIKVIGNTYRVDADVVPAYRHKDFTNDYYMNSNNYIGGIEIHPDSGGRIINYPEQHIKNGIAKNKETNYYFKKCVRVIKNLREHMQENGHEISEEISSFGLESLLWNVPSQVYVNHSGLSNLFYSVIKYLISDFNSFDSYREANGIKFLFSDGNKKASYMSFLLSLKKFYEGTL